MKKTTTLLLLTLLSTTINANNIEITKQTNITKETAAKIFCKYLVNGDIKSISKHFVGKNLEHINIQSMEGLNLMSELISKRYTDADCNYINIEKRGNFYKAYPYGTSWSMSLSVNTEYNTWKALEY